MQEPQEATQPSPCPREGSGLPKTFSMDSVDAASGKGVRSGVWLAELQWFWLSS